MISDKSELYDLVDYKMIIKCSKRNFSCEQNVYFLIAVN